MTEHKTLHTPHQTPSHKEAFWATDTIRYRTVGMHLVERCVQGCALSPNGLHAVVIANDYAGGGVNSLSVADSAVRLYEIGRREPSAFDESDVEDGFNSSDDEDHGAGDMDVMEEPPFSIARLGHGVHVVPDLEEFSSDNDDAGFISWADSDE